jgi:GNAT superfamily N-acetyltransferase
VIETDPAAPGWPRRTAGPSGAGLAILREGLWGLSMLVVHPDAQSGGVGRALLERTLRYGDGARGGIIASSGDSRALRAYARAGFAMHPAVQASGVPRTLEVPASVREGRSPISD